MNELAFIDLTGNVLTNIIASLAIKAGEPAVIAALNALNGLLRELKTPANHDLQRAFTRSCLNGVMVACNVCKQKLEIQYQAITHRTLNTRAIELEQKIEQIDSLIRIVGNYRTEFPLSPSEYIIQLLDSPELLMANQGGDVLKTAANVLREKIEMMIFRQLKAWQPDIPKELEEAIIKGWHRPQDGSKRYLYSEICDFFLNELETNEKVKTTFTTRLLADIMAQNKSLADLMAIEFEDRAKQIHDRLTILEQNILNVLNPKFTNSEIRHMASGYLRAELRRIKRKLYDRIGKEINYILPDIRIISDNNFGRDNQQSFGNDQTSVCKTYRSPEFLAHGLCKSLNDFDGNLTIISELVKAISEPARRKEDTPIFWALNQARVLITADSGLGKTTFMESLFLMICAGALAQVETEECVLPFFITNTQAASMNIADLRELLTSRFAPHIDQASKLNQFILDSLESGRFVFFFDAIDQVRFMERGPITELLEDPLIEQNRIIISSRPFFWQMEKNQFRRFVVLEIQEFDHERQAKYIAQAGTQNLAISLDERSLAIPVILRILSDLRHCDIRKIHNRSELYREVLSQLLQRPEEKDAVPTLSVPSANEVRDSLRKLAYDSLTYGFRQRIPRSIILQNEILGREQLRELSSGWGIISVRDEDDLEFRHLSFQEYLAAEYLKGYMDRSNCDLSLLWPFILHPDWEESIRFLAGMLNGKSAAKLIDMILNPLDRSVLVYYRDHIRLACLCLNEIGEAGQAERDILLARLREDLQDPVLNIFTLDYLHIFKDYRITHLLSALIKSENLDIKKCVIRTLGKIKSAESVRLLFESLKNTSTDIQTDAIRALVESNSSEAIQPLIETLSDENEFIREIAVYALGEIRNRVAAKPLIAALKDVCANVRKSAINALWTMDTPEAAEALVDMLTDQTDSVRYQAARVLCYSDISQAVPVLIESIRSGDSDAYWDAFWALHNVKSEESLDVLIDALRDENAEVRQVAAIGLRNIDSKKALLPLIEALKDDDESVRYYAIKALSQGKYKEAVKPIFMAVDFENDEKSDQVSRAGIMALASIGTSEAISLLLKLFDCKKPDYFHELIAYELGRINSEVSLQLLIEALKEKSTYVRRGAAIALGKSNSSEAIQPLIEALNDENEIVREAVASALSKGEAVEVVKPLIAALKDEYTDVRLSAISSLGFINTSEALGSLVDLLTDKTDYVRFQAGAILCRNRFSQAVTVMIEALSHEDENWRDYAALVLGEVRNPKAVGPLIDALGDSSNVVRSSVSNALGNYRSQYVNDLLIGALGHKNTNTREGAAKALGYIKCSEAVDPLIEILKDENEMVRVYSAGALGSIISEKAVEPLIGTALHDESEFVQWRAIWALGEIESFKTVWPLIRLLKCKRWMVWLGAVQALGKLKPIEAVRPLIAELRTDNNIAQGTVVEALKGIRNEEALEEFIQAYQTEADRITQWSLIEHTKEIETTKELEELMHAYPGGSELFAQWSVTVDLKEIKSLEKLKEFLKVHLAEPNPQIARLLLRLIADCDRYLRRSKQIAGGYL